MHTSGNLADVVTAELRVVSLRPVPASLVASYYYSDYCTRTDI